MRILLLICVGALLCAALALGQLVTHAASAGAPAPAVTTTPSVVAATCVPSHPDPSLTPIPGNNPRSWLPLIERAC